MNDCKIPLARPSHPRYHSAAETINDVIAYLNAFGDNKRGAILYLGERQREAMLHLNHRREDSDDVFCGWPVLWVLKDSHIHLAM